MRRVTWTEGLQTAVHMSYILIIYIAYPNPLRMRGNSRNDRLEKAIICSSGLRAVPVGHQKKQKSGYHLRSSKSIVVQPDSSFSEHLHELPDTTTGTLGADGNRMAAKKAADLILAFSACTTDVSQSVQSSQLVPTHTFDGNKCRPLTPHPLCLASYRCLCWEGRFSHSKATHCGTCHRR